jgi:signal peptidase I
MPKPTGATEPSAKSALRENIESLLWALGLALLIRTFIIAPYKIPSGSMRMTLLQKDRILVNKYHYRFHEPQAGDIVVFKNPVDRRAFIKRLVAKEGQAVEIRDGHLYVDGALLNEPEIFSENHYYNQGPYGQTNQVITVPEDMYYVLGDNSASSQDSRFWGFVPQKNMIGKAVCIFWPLDRIRKLK